MATLEQTIKDAKKTSRKIYQGICCVCKNIFFTIHPERATICSKYCRGKPKVKTQCLYCKKSIIKRHWDYYISKKHFCNKKCSGKYIRGAIHHSWKGGHIKSNGYKTIQVNAKSILEHRHVMQQILNRTLRKNEIVHHINSNKIDNRPENLIVMDIKKHVSLHKKGIRKKII